MNFMVTLLTALAWVLILLAIMLVLLMVAMIMTCKIRMVVMTLLSFVVNACDRGTDNDDDDATGDD
eukprot:8050768-Lingulodinium_polyedra.AAC.1